MQNLHPTEFYTGSCIYPCNPCEHKYKFFLPKCCSSNEHASLTEKHVLHPMDYWIASHGLLGCIPWITGLHPMDYWVASHGLLGCIPWITGLHPMDYWVASHGLLGCIPWITGLHPMDYRVASHGLLGCIPWINWVASHGLLCCTTCACSMELPHHMQKGEVHISICNSIILCYNSDDSCALSYTYSTSALKEVDCMCRAGGSSLGLAWRGGGSSLGLVWRGGRSSLGLVRRGGRSLQQGGMGERCKLLHWVATFALYKSKYIAFASCRLSALLHYSMLCIYKTMSEFTKYT